MRYTHEWTDAELDYLTAHYALRGSAFIRARYPAFSDNALRQMATRLNLADDLREYRTLREIADEAGVTTRAVHRWLSSRPWARRHLRTWGTDTLIPAPVERLYLNEMRRASRPRGWLSTPQAAARLNITRASVYRACQSGTLTCTWVRGAYYVDPHDMPTPKQTTPPPNTLTLSALARVAGEHAMTLHRKLRVTGTLHHAAGGRPAKLTTADHARAFLSSRGHHAEQVETIIRRAIALTVRTDMEESNERADDR